MKLFGVLIGLLILNLSATAQVTPTGVTLNQVETVSKKLSGAFSTRTANTPKALGEDFEFEVSTFYQDLEQNGLDEFDSSVSNNFTDSFLTLRKGLYWNIDISVSTVLPGSEDLISGFSFNVEHTGKVGTFVLKSDVYLSQHNLNDILNLETTGLSFVFYKKLSSFYLGLGGNVESISADYNGNSLSNSSESRSIDFMETALIAKATKPLGLFRLSGTYTFRNSSSTIYSISIGKRF